MPRHGGEDPGASKNGIIEKNLTLDISNELYKELEKYGIPVYMTRNIDETLNPTERVNRILDAFGNSEDVIVVSNHINAGGGDGAEVIYALRNPSTLSNIIVEQLEKAGQNIRKVYQRRAYTDTSKDYYFIHRNTGVTEPVIVEYGFLDSTGDDVNQLKNNYKDYAVAVARAIAEYVGITSSDDNTYIVKKGDSLWTIAKKFNTTVDKIKNKNNLSSNLLSIGQALEIPIETEEVVNVNKYIVKAGDTLYSIAKNYNINVDRLKKYNNLNNSILSIGQVIYIPNEIIPVSSNQYVVEKGDTLYSISIKNGISVDELKKYNNLSTNTLSIGQIIYLPILNEYTVEKGDTLYSIAKKNNTTVDNLINLNNLSTNTLKVGQKLIVK